MSKKKTEVRSQKSEETAPEETLEITLVRKGAPRYTLHADERWGMLAMIALYRVVQEWGASEELRREVEGVMREFEFWEEAHRGDPAA